MALNFFWAFIVGGAFCVIGQLLMDIAKLTPAHTMVTFVVAGSILGGLDMFQPLVDFAGAGATTPIINFGASLTKGALETFATDGWIGLLTGLFKSTGAGISAAIIFSFLAALITKPKS